MEIVRRGLTVKVSKDHSGRKGHNEQGLNGSTDEGGKKKAKFEKQREMKGSERRMGEEAKRTSWPESTAPL